MRTIIIYIDLSLLNNFAILGKAFHVNIDQETIRVIFQTKKEALIRNNVVIKNFDLAIDDCSDHDTSYFLACYTSPGELINLPRFSKSEQMARLITYLTKLSSKDKKHFLIPPTYVCTDRYHENEWAVEGVIEGRKDLIIKPNGGAQGRGQVFISKDRNFSITAFTEILTTKGKMEEFEKKVIEFIKENPSWVHLNPDDEPILDILNNTEEKKFPFSSHRHLINGLYDGFIVQEYIPNIKHEFRLISDHNSKIVYIQERERENKLGYFPQATGKHATEYRSLDTDVKLFYSLFETDEDLNVFEEIIKNVIGPMNAIDVFFTGSGKVGIFEWQHQWGIDGIPKKIAYSIQEEFIIDFIKTSNLLN